MNRMTKAENGLQVIANFIVRTNEGVLVSEGPQKLTLGAGEALRAIEDAIIGMSVGDEKTLMISSDDAFGPRRDELMLRIPRGQLPPGMAPESGAVLTGENDSGETVRLTIVEVDADAVIADGNHPLAGVDLHIDLSLAKIVNTDTE